MLLGLPLRWSQIAGPLIVLCIALVFHLLPYSVTEWLDWHRHAIRDCQWWRLISGHFLHTNTMHLLLNSAGVLMLWAIFGHGYRWHQHLFEFLLLALLTGLILLLIPSEMVSYVGLSGILHGVFVLRAIDDIKTGWRLAWLMLIGVLAKVAWEMTQGASNDVAQLIDARVAVEAHLAGCVAGLLLFMARQLILMIKK